MKNAIILHGAPEKENYYDADKPSESNAHWLPWLQKELIIRDIKADTPEVPHSYEPEWDTWCREVERFDIGQETLVVGHSAGAGFWLRYLCDNPALRVAKLILVAPWLDPYGTLREKSFFDFAFDRLLARRTGGLHLLYAVDDSDSVQQSVTTVKSNIDDIKSHEFRKGFGHFTYENLKSSAFPELLDIVLSQ